MNAERRQKLERVMAELEEIAQDERSALDNLPEGLQQSERGQTMEAAADNLDEAVESARRALEGE